MTSPALDLDRNGLVILDRAECLGFLARASLGRIGITVGALPSILPVNFRFVDGKILFRTGHGTKLDAATANTVVAFEIDDFDPMDHTGWSVLVAGIARTAVDPYDIAVLDASSIPRWVPARDDRVVEITPQLISGRRIVHGAESASQ